jgi:hypothetical protein
MFAPHTSVYTESVGMSRSVAVTLVLTDYRCMYTESDVDYFETV